jgi:two-component system chemotaxis response regulator CheY
VKTILLVDDSRVTRNLMAVYLVAKNVTLLEAADGEEALAMMRAQRPDVVVADLRMPRLDGPSMCKAMQDDPALCTIPVVILTSNRDAESIDRCRAAGAREVLFKPIQPRPFLEAIHRNLPATAPSSEGRS